MPNIRKISTYGFNQSHGPCSDEQLAAHSHKDLSMDKSLEYYPGLDSLIKKPFTQNSLQNLRPILTRTCLWINP